MSEPYETRLLRLAFASDDDAPALHGFAVYRTMIRGRLLAMAQQAYRRSWALLGAARCDASFARYLEVAPPRSPLVREVIHGFAAFAASGGLGEGAPFARDLLRFEATKWELADALAPAVGEVAELDFEGVPVLDPTLRVLTLEWAVDDPEQPPSRDPHALLMYRREEDDALRWYRVELLFGALLARVAAHGESLGEALPALLAERAMAADEAWLAALAGFLATAVERGVVRGVRAPVR